MLKTKNRKKMHRQKGKLDRRPIMGKSPKTRAVNEVRMPIDTENWGTENPQDGPSNDSPESLDRIISRESIPSKEGDEGSESVEESELGRLDGKNARKR